MLCHILEVNRNGFIFKVLYLFCSNHCIFFHVLNRLLLSLSFRVSSKIRLVARVYAVVAFSLKHIDIAAILVTIRNLIIDDRVKAYHLLSILALLIC